MARRTVGLPHARLKHPALRYQHGHPMKFRPHQTLFYLVSERRNRESISCSHKNTLEARLGEQSCRFLSQVNQYVIYSVQKPTCSARESAESRDRPCWCSRANPFNLRKDELGFRVNELRVQGQFYGYPIPI